VTARHAPYTSPFWSVQAARVSLAGVVASRAIGRVKALACRLALALWRWAGWAVDAQQLLVVSARSRADRGTARSAGAGIFGSQ